MNRFLTDLVERAEGRAPLLQRRPRSLFEPDSPARAPATEPLEREELREATPAPRLASDEVSRSPKALKEPLQPRHAEHVASAHRPATPHAARSERRDGRVAPPAPQHADPLPARRSPPVARADDATASPRRETAPPAPVTSPRAMPRAPSALRPESAPPRRQAKESSTTERDSRERRETSAPMPQKPLTPLAQVPPAPPVAPTMVSRAQPLAKHPAVALARSQTTLVTHREQVAPPPVQITIGRVEVRAAPTGSERAPRDRGPAKPRLSLDEYLRQRGGASR